MNTIDVAQACKSSVLWREDAADAMRITIETIADAYGRVRLDSGLVQMITSDFANVMLGQIIERRGMQWFENHIEWTHMKQQIEEKVLHLLLDGDSTNRSQFPVEFR